MANKKITDLTLRSDVDGTVNLPGDDAIQTWRVTAAQIKDYVVNEAKSTFKPPTRQIFTTGSGTYVRPAGVRQIRIKMAGGGGGGAGATGTGGSGTGGSDGTNTTFGASLLTCGFGAGAPYGGAAPTGGAGTINSPAVGYTIEGGAGAGYTYQSGADSGGTCISGGSGGMTYFGGAGQGGGDAQKNATPGKPNTGAGGGGGATPRTTIGCFAGPGGAAGAFIDAIIDNPAGSYAYSIGSGGGGGSGGSGSGGNGGDGGSGVIIVDEYY